jgi:hypothetical protein
MLPRFVLIRAPFTIQGIAPGAGGIINGLFTII